MDVLANIETQIKERISGFHSETGQRPSRIFIIRDGISNSQFFEVGRAMNAHSGS